MQWDSEQYWLKAVRYAELASQPERETWERPFWLSLSLEFLARAALTRVHPALNADPDGDGVHLLYAFGVEVKGQPKSLPIHAVLLRLQRIAPEQFTKSRREFCDFFSNVRNQELHTSELPFLALSETKWLAPFYDVCKVLCDRLGRTLEDLFGYDESQTAEALIVALQSKKTSEVMSRIGAHKKVFDGLPEAERTRLVAQADLFAPTWVMTASQAKCPACGSKAKLSGTTERVSRPFYNGSELLVKNTVLADRLECMACNLSLKNLDELLVADIEPHFSFDAETELHEYHEPDQYEEYNNM